ncbi:diguanylate cyclase [Amorphus sp. MBR-141]
MNPTGNLLDLYRCVLDAIPLELAVVDRSGQIIWVNAMWERFAERHGIAQSDGWPNSNYFDICSAALDSESAAVLFSGLSKVLDGHEREFSIEYPFSILNGEQWFLVNIKKIEFGEIPLILISHMNITDGKRTEEKLRQLAHRDGLTDLANRREFDRFILDEFKRAQRIGQPVSLLLIDVDFFKDYNDEYGHLAGDDVLRAVGRTLNEFVGRPSDLVARYGGEEFAIVLGNTALQGAAEIAERVHRAIADLNLPFPEAPPGRVTMSIGAATTFPARSSTPDDLIDAADDALYAAKENGRDRVELYGAGHSL